MDDGFHSLFANVGVVESYWGSRGGLEFSLAADAENDLGDEGSGMNEGTGDIRNRFDVAFVDGEIAEKGGVKFMFCFEKIGQFRGIADDCSRNSLIWG